MPERGDVIFLPPTTVDCSDWNWDAVPPKSTTLTVRLRPKPGGSANEPGRATNSVLEAIGECDRKFGGQGFELLSQTAEAEDVVLQLKPFGQDAEARVAHVIRVLNAAAEIASLRGSYEIHLAMCT